jgi:hypothetical protein
MLNIIMFTMYTIMCIMSIGMTVYSFIVRYKNNHEINEYKLCYFPYKPVPKHMIKNHSQYSQCTKCESLCQFCNRPQGICSRYTHKH